MEVTAGFLLACRLRRMDAIWGQMRSSNLCYFWQFQLSQQPLGAWKARSSNTLGSKATTIWSGKRFEVKSANHSPEIHFLVSLNTLHAGWVKHNANLSSDSLWRQVSAESATNNSIGSVSSADLSPIDAELVAVFVSGGSLGDKGNLLSVIELGSGLVINALDLDQRHIVVLVAETSLETKDGTINVKAWASLRCWL